MNPEGKDVDQTTPEQEVEDTLDFPVEGEDEEVEAETADEEETETSTEPEIDWKSRAEAAEKRSRTLDKKYNKLVDRNQHLIDKITAKEDSGQTLSDEEKKERQAAEYIRNEARKVYEEEQRKREEAQQQALDQLDEEMETVLTENPDLAERQVREVIELFQKKNQQVTPTLAAEMLKNGFATKKSTRVKPKLPKTRPSSGELPKEEVKEMKGLSFDEKITKIQQNALKKLGL